MTPRLRAALASVVLAALLVPLSASASIVPAQPGSSGGTSFDTPAPTPRPTRKPRRTPKPKKTAKPVATAEPAADGAPVPVSFPPARRTLTVGYMEPGVLGQVPLLLALERGYFVAEGFDDVRLVQVADPLADLASGDLDFAVAASAEAYAAAEAGLRAVSGYQNFDADGQFSGGVLMATQALVADEPSTLITFLSAYIRALQDLNAAEGAAEALATLQETDLAIDADVADDWADAVSVYAPFDGGFGDIDDEGGLGELSVHLTDGDTEPDLGMFVAQDAVNIAQAWHELPANPANALIGAPGLTEISVGLPMSDGAPSPVDVAADAGFFDAAGFDSVEVLEVEQPLPGVVSGQIDFAIIDAVDAADGSAQGLPLRAIAGHRNYDAAGDAYGGDVVVVSDDLLATEPSTVAAFLIAYLNGLESLRDSVNASAYSPHDGGFGERDLGGGLAGLRGYLAAETGTEPDLGTLVVAPALNFAQAWRGVPANPVVTTVPNEDS